MIIFAVDILTNNDIIEILSGLAKLAEYDGVVKWNNFLDDMKTLIIEHYDGKHPKMHKGEWKRRFKAS